MATKLTKAVSRETEMEDINGTKGDVVVTIDAKGVTLRAKGKQRKFTIPWEKIGKVADLPLNAPAKYAGNQIGWLVGD